MKDRELCRPGELAIVSRKAHPYTQISRLPRVNNAIDKLADAYASHGVTFRSTPALIERVLIDAAESIDGTT